MEFVSHSEFKKEFDGLLKKWPSLKSDLERLKNVLQQVPRGYPPGIVRISGLGVKTEIYKVKHFRCKDMKGKGSHSGIRIVYAYLPNEDKIEFIEIYYKEKEDRDCNKERIENYYT
ncbi:MAG: hypothetical protein NC905_00800 [Candidatus Omnitrophica bacterium]|nr:hypothetical protein [Candidatus Omnitrophota bacterium]